MKYSDTEYEKLQTEGKQVREHKGSTGRKPLRREIREARAKGREFLLQYRLFRYHQTGQIIDACMTRLSFPPRWRYDVLRALDYFRECAVEMEKAGQPSRWNTLRALRVLQWYQGTNGHA